MKIIQPSVEILTKIDSNKVLQDLERIGKTCYKSEANITEDSANAFIKKIIKNGHLSVIEHFSITARVICDRGVSHELVRHRIASYSQESTRYVRYDKGLEVIAPCFWEEDDDKMKEFVCYGDLGYCDSKLKLWKFAMSQAEEYYKVLIEGGATPQEARSVLPNSLKTEIVVTMNLRAWRHFFKLRCAAAAHPQMRQIAFMLLSKISKQLPIVFDDIVKELFDGTED